MKLLSLVLILTASLLMSVDAFAAYTRCRWSVEGQGSNPLEKDDPLYKAGPKMIAPAACTNVTHEAPATLPNPICTGYLYCESDQKNTPPKNEAASCFAVDAGGGKFKCPDGFKCSGDDKVTLKTNTRIPSPTAAAPAAAPGNGAAKK